MQVGKRQNSTHSTIPLKTISKKQVEELSKGFTNKLKLDYKCDPRLIGGLIIQVGSAMIDTSIINKLKQLENKMIGA